MILKELLFVFWFFAPAGVANVMAFFSSKIPYVKKFNQPVDARIKFRGKRILGSHKTIRGFVFGITMAIVCVYVEIFLYNQIPLLQDLLPIDYKTIDPITLGFLLGFGALAGDAIKSFFKRQVNFPPGKSWVPFDQIDYILGGIVFTYFYIPLSIFEYILLFLVWFLLHPLLSFWGYILKLKRQPI